MTKYNDIIEYIDSTYDIDFEKVKVWAKENNADIIELIDRRKTNNGKLYRYFQVVEREVPEPSEDDKKALRIAVLKRELAETDYVVIKIAEGAATTEDYADVIAKRQQWRAEINSLENTIDIL